LTGGSRLRGSLHAERGNPRLLPYFHAIGDVVEHAGPAGSGSVVKLLSNLLSTVNMATAAEVISCGEELGIDWKALILSLTLGSASSRAMRTL
jgi:3-hydroxyisobutyrate dehydrogenase